MLFRYSRAALAERKWHKFVLHNSERVGLEDVLEACEGPVMRHNGGTWTVIMIADEIDRIRAKMNWSSEADRGYGNWAGKRYSSATSNSMHPSR